MANKKVTTVNKKPANSKEKKDKKVEIEKKFKIELDGLKMQIKLIEESLMIPQVYARVRGAMFDILSEDLVDKDLIIDAMKETDKTIKDIDKKIAKIKTIDDAKKDKTFDFLPYTISDMDMEESIAINYVVSIMVDAIAQKYNRMQSVLLEMDNDK